MSQALEALKLANQVRFARADLKRAIRTGDVKAADVIREMPSTVETMPLIELVACQYGWGPQRTRRLLRAVAVTADKTIGSMTQRQRDLVACLLEGDEAAIREAELDRGVERWLIERRGRGHAA